MKTPILTLLQMSPETYEKLIFQHYLQWCLLNSHNEKEDLQKLLANTALFNWWMIQYHHLENKFIQDATEYHGKCHKKVMRAFYAEITVEIGRYYPKALINAARNQQPLTPQLN